jgi:DNA-binding NtrC family response regulator
VSAGQILVVEDDPASAAYLRLTLEESGYQVRAAPDGCAGLKEVESELPDLIISDLQMPKLDGLSLLSRVTKRWPQLPFIMLTVEENVSHVVEAMRLGAANYLTKPVSPAGLRLATQKALKRRSADTRSDPDPSTELQEIVGNSAAMARLRTTVGIAARSDVNILISGETGAGKELVARAIHRCSNLSSGKWVAHNCAATPAELFESHFFGHRRGAFTGAESDHIGLLEQADGGDLVLDELEVLSLVHQAKLLRVLDDGEVRRVGGTKIRQVSVRIIALTNRDPSELIAEGRLRADLYYRLGGFSLHPPPLREHPEDIEQLANNFLGRDSMLSDAALRTLCLHDWPGNVRELRNVLRSAMATSNGERIDAAHLWFDQRDAPRTASANQPAPGRTLKDSEREAIVSALQFFDGNRNQTAQALGINRSTLRRKISEHGITINPRSGANKRNKLPFRDVR